MERVTVGWNEDIDLNAGAAAIAVMGGQDSLRKVLGTDQIQINNEGGAFLKQVRWVDESAKGIDGTIEISGRARKIHFGKQSALDPHDSRIILHDNNDMGIFLPKNTKLDVLGNKSGSGVEQHAVLMDLIRPDLQPVATVSLKSVTRSFILGLKTGTLVAATFSGSSDVLGQGLAYEDSEISFDENEDTDWCLIGIIPGPGGAGFGVCGFRHTNLVVDRAFPAKLGDVSTREFFLDDLNPMGPQKGWLFKGNAPPILKAAGVSTTSTEYGIHIGLVGKDAQR